MIRVKMMAYIQYQVEFADGLSFVVWSASAGRNSDRSLIRMAASTIATIEKTRVNEAVRGKSKASTQRLKASTTMKARPQSAWLPQSNWVKNAAMKAKMTEG